MSSGWGWPEFQFQLDLFMNDFPYLDIRCESNRNHFFLNTYRSLFLAVNHNEYATRLFVTVKLIVFDVDGHHQASLHS